MQSVLPESELPTEEYLTSDHLHWARSKNEKELLITILFLSVLNTEYQQGMPLYKLFHPDLQVLTCVCSEGITPANETFSSEDGYEFTLCRRCAGVSPIVNCPETGKEEPMSFLFMRELIGTYNKDEESDKNE